MCDTGMGELQNNGVENEEMKQRRIKNLRDTGKRESWCAESEPWKIDSLFRNLQEKKKPLSCLGTKSLREAAGEEKQRVKHLP